MSSLAASTSADNRAECMDKDSQAIVSPSNTAHGTQQGLSSDPFSSPPPLQHTQPHSSNPSSPVITISSSAEVPLNNSSQSIEESEVEEQEDEWEEECLDEGIVPGASCFFCSQPWKKSCVICLQSFCETHLPKCPPLSFDANRVLPFKCDLCLHKRPTGGISVCEETETAVIKDGIQLPHVVYQFNVQESPSQHLTDVFQSLLNSPAFITILNDDESRMKEYLLRPEKRKFLASSCAVLSNLSHLQTHIRDKRIIFIHFKYTPSNLLQLISILPSETSNIDKIDERLKESDIKLGLLIRRGALNADSPNKTSADSKKFHIRLEMYVHHSRWKELSLEERRQLKYLQHAMEDWYRYQFMQWNMMRKSQGLPVLLLTSIRDSFQLKLISKTTNIDDLVVKRKYTKTQWYFSCDDLPPGYPKDTPAITIIDDENKEHRVVPVGVATYNGYFTAEEISFMETQVDQVDDENRTHAGVFKDYPNTAQCTFKRTKLVRTKFFFNARYLFQSKQIRGNPDAHKAEGIRVDVAESLPWMHKVVDAMVEGRVIPSDYVNQVALNIYHDGSEGIKQHVDDPKRFDRPVYSIRLFSPSRLCFGSTGFSMSNSVFFIPMPASCITVLGPGYAADAIKHCVRACDMNGKSATLLFRKIHPQLLQQASELLSETASKSQTPSSTSPASETNAQTPQLSPDVTQSPVKLRPESQRLPDSPIKGISNAPPPGSPYVLKAASSSVQHSTAVPQLSAADINSLTALWNRLSKANLTSELIKTATSQTPSKTVSSSLIAILQNLAKLVPQSQIQGALKPTNSQVTPLPLSVAPQTESPTATDTSASTPQTPSPPVVSANQALPSPDSHTIKSSQNSPLTQQPLPPQAPLLEKISLNSSAEIKSVSTAFPTSSRERVFLNSSKSKIVGAERTPLKPITNQIKPHFKPTNNYHQTADKPSLTTTHEFVLSKQSPLKKLPSVDEILAKSMQLPNYSKQEGDSSTIVSLQPLSKRKASDVEHQKADETSEFKANCTVCFKKQKL